MAPLTQLAVPSSFDYARQSALYLPTSLPEPREPGFPEAVAEEIARLVEVTGGRAFALFTSLRKMASGLFLACRLAFARTLAKVSSFVPYFFMWLSPAPPK